MTDETFWRKWDEWIPDGQNMHDDLPYFIVCPRENWGLVRGEILDENPSYPVKLISPTSALYGWRIRGYEWRHALPEQRSSAFVQEWERLSLACRVSEVIG